MMIIVQLNTHAAHGLWRMVARSESSNINTRLSPGTYHNMYLGKVNPDKLEREYAAVYGQYL